MQQTIFSNWTLFRLLKLAIGFFIAMDAFKHADWLFVCMGLYFVFIAIFNVGCGSCNTGQCDNNTNIDQE